MPTLFRLTEKKMSPVAGTKVIKSDDAVFLMEGNQILEKAQMQASTILEEANAIYELRKQEGYDDGLAEGKMEHTEKIMETVLSSLEFIENIEKTVVEVVGSSVKKLIGEFNKDELIVGIVRQALNSVRSQQKVIIRVAVEDSNAVSEALAIMIQNKSSGFIDIIPDSRLKHGSCILESELGVIDASLDIQLLALEKAFKSKIEN